MMRNVRGVVGGFVVWVLAWVGIEMTLSAIWPEGYGAHQAAFQSAIENGGQFTADTTLLLIQLVTGALVSVLAGFVAALIARDSNRAPRILGVLLLAVGLMKVTMSWPYVPIWHHVLFIALLMPMAMLGGRLKTTEVR